MKKILFFSIIFLSLFYTKISFSQVEVLSDKDTSVTFKAGDKFSISLDSNPSTGYTWAICITDGSENLLILNSEFASPRPPVPGQGGTQIWHFKILSPGNIKIEFRYMQPWSDEEPAKTLVFKVKVE
jgi:inhibitor of cysteine peptidase